MTDKEYIGEITITIQVTRDNKFDMFSSGLKTEFYNDVETTQDFNYENIDWALQVKARQIYHDFLSKSNEDER